MILLKKSIILSSIFSLVFIFINAGCELTSKTKETDPVNNGYSVTFKANGNTVTLDKGDSDFPESPFTFLCEGYSCAIILAENTSTGQFIEIQFSYNTEEPDDFEQYEITDMFYGDENGKEFALFTQTDGTLVFNTFGAIGEDATGTFSGSLFDMDSWVKISEPEKVMQITEGTFKIKHIAEILDEE